MICKRPPYSLFAPHMAFETHHNARQNQPTDSVEWKRERYNALGKYPHCDLRLLTAYRASTLFYKQDYHTFKLLIYHF